MNEITIHDIEYKCQQHYTLDKCLSQPEFAICAANIKALEPDDHDFDFDFDEYYLNVQINRRKAALDQVAEIESLDFQDPEALERMWSDIRQPGLVLTFHYGSFRILPRLMLIQGFKVAVLMSRDVRNRQEQILLSQATAMGKAEHIAFINAEDPLCLRQMTQLHTQGFHLLVYLDGNTGLQDIANTTDGYIQSFMASRLVLRKGLAAWCYRMHWRVYTVLNTSCWFDKLAFAHQCLYIDASKVSLDQYIRIFFGKAYAMLEKAMQRDPDAWEGLLYVQRLAPIHQWNKTPEMIPLQMGRQLIALDIANYCWHYISKSQYRKYRRRFLERLAP